MSSERTVPTFRDLESWSFAGTALAVFGHPIGHSLSPPMHNAALAELAGSDSRFANWRYFRFEIHPDDLPRALELAHARGFHGINLTVPHKVIAVAHVREIDPSARPVGAVNTLLRREGSWQGFNTDGYGLNTAVHETLGRTLSGSHIVLLGAGGAARGAAVECLARRCASLWIANRTRQNLAVLLEHLQPFASGISVQGFTPDTPPQSLPSDTLVINATSAGLRPDDPLPIDLGRLPAPAAVFDMIYNPARTPLLQQAEARGIPWANGLSMLVHQGAKSLEIWSGVSAARTSPAMQVAARQALGV